MARSLAPGPARSLFVGVVLAATMAVIALVGGALGIATLWPILLATGLGMVIGVPDARHLVMVTAGAVTATVGAGAQVALLPATPGTRAAVLAGSVLLLAVIAALGRGRLPLGVALVAWGATTALLEPAIAAEPTALLTIASTTLATVLAGFGLGLLVAQVVALLGGTRSVAILVLLVPSLGLVDVLGAAPSGGPLRVAVAQAQEAGPVAPSTWVGAGRSGLVEGDVRTLAHRQVVLVPSGPDGAPRDGFVITQLHVSGTGPVRIVLEDQAVGGLRDTGALRAPAVEGTTVVHELDLGTVGAGDAMVRTVATLERALPVTLAITYELDGSMLRAEQLVGRSGRLSITYTLTNRTAEPREVRYFDGLGRARTDVREVAVPMGATIAVPLDARFSGVVAPDASVIAGDGGGGTQVNASLALFGPSGAATRTFTITTDVVDAVAPPAAVRVVPLGARTSPDWRASAETLARFSAALDAASDAAGLLGTAASALGTYLPDDGAAADAVLDQLAATIAGLGTALIDGTAGVEADLVWLALQDERFEAGDGFLHGMLADADVTLVYAFDVAGLGADVGPSLPVRLVVALALFTVVGLLGRSVAGRERTQDPEGR